MEQCVYISLFGPFYHMVKFPEYSLLQTIKKGFMIIFCSLYQIGSHLLEKVDRLRLSHQTRTSTNALWGLFCNTLNQTHLSSFTAVPRGSMDLSVFLYSIINFPCSREQWPLQEIILYSKLLCPKVATIKRFNGINAKWLLSLSSTWELSRLQTYKWKARTKLNWFGILIYP